LTPTEGPTYFQKIQILDEVNIGWVKYAVLTRIALEAISPVSTQLPDPLFNGIVFSSALFRSLKTIYNSDLSPSDKRRVSTIHVIGTSCAFAGSLYINLPKE